ncbi:MAG: cytochrome P450 [Gammaproteobacteria bacterium]|jgi:cytochrome P450|nr:cytochrome P450 [Gammaproteobacteria bacterium]MBP6050811.1 cytochrome P450 [Pseudomonadales bacterium]MBK6584401.1 cytochrome P450 [Gammaproteobacteria bacterium]MBK7520860.1 cytochrome P450 [Gammaproteobacteria bacterium]MBK7727894.1 cytochrome P450 [Gammaproteobacteria bacterium]
MSNSLASIDFATEQMPGPHLHQTLRRLREQHPVSPARFAGLPAFVISGHAELAEAFRDNQRFPPANAYRLTFEPVVGVTFQTMEDEAHRVYRRLATPAFRSAAVERMEVEGLAQLAHGLIDAMPDGGCDLARYFTHRYSFLVISRMLGIPFDREEEFREWARGFLEFRRNERYARECARQITAYLVPILGQRRRQPRDDVISGLILADADGHRLDDEEILANIRLLFAAGASTTTDAMGNLLHALLTVPGAWATLRTEPGLRSNAIEELLRWESPVAVLPRISATAPIEFAGVEIPPNTFCLFAIAAANRDPKVYVDANRFDLGRHSDNKLLSFGPGPRLCPGMHLARKQMAVALDVLVERLPRLQLVEPAAALPIGTVLRGPAALPVSY